MNTNYKILITGGTGYLGSNLAEYLAERNYDVTVLGRREINFKHKDIKIIHKDLRELDAKDISESNVIFHLAAVFPNNSSSTPQEIFSQNTESTLHLLNLINSTNNVNNINTNVAQIKLIFSSTAGVYGRDSRMNSRRFSEKDNLNPNELYSCSKVCCEQLIQTYARRNPHLNYLIFRISNLYGPRQNHSQKSVVSDIITNILSLNPNNSGGMKLINPQSVRDFIYINDCVEAIAFGLEKNLSGVYNLGTGKPTTIEELASELIRISGKKIKVIKENKNSDTNTLNISKLKREGWLSKISLKKGLKITYQQLLDS